MPHGKVYSTGKFPFYVPNYSSLLKFVNKSKSQSFKKIDLSRNLVLDQRGTLNSA